MDWTKRRHFLAFECAIMLVGKRAELNNKQAS
nr:MAG TPA_asm: hypothetical protein [Caudoviricetes sp.]